MKKLNIHTGFLIVFGFLFFACSSSLHSSSVNHDRAGLLRLMDQYLASLADNDLSEVPLSDDVMLVENLQKTPIGEGLWKTATGGPTDFKIFVADPVAREVAFMGVIEEKGKPVIAAIRLHVMNNKIKEIDHLVVHAKDDKPLDPNMERVRPALLKNLPENESSPRERMREIANSYYEAVVNGNGDLAPFADECERRENGFITANNQTIEVSKVEESGFPPFAAMKCGEQLNTGIMGYITAMTDRRILAIDEEKGLVFAFSIIRHNGEPKVLKITGVPGITERPNKWGPFDTIAAHIFKIRNGRIYEIEAMGYREEHGVTNGWK
jgi:hypothetical protein